MNPRLYDDYVLQVLKQGNMTKAAGMLGISQPALSSGLSNLEAELGFKIFNRRTTPISVTPEGTLYIDYIDRLNTLSIDFRRRLAACHKESDNRVIIGGPSVYIESTVTRTIIRMLRFHPDFRVGMKTAPMKELIEMAERGVVNCFIATNNRLPDSFERIAIKREKLYLCVPAGNPINQRLERCRIRSGESGEILDYSLLDGQRFICLEDDQPLQIQLERFASDYGFRYESGIQVNQVSMAVNLAIRGQGICLASEDALSQRADILDIRVYELPESVSGREIYVTYNKELYMPEACRVLIEQLKEECQEADGWQGHGEGVIRFAHRPGVG